MSCNSNILTYERNSEATTSGLLIDKLTYQYERASNGKLATNRLRYMHDVQGNGYACDFKTGPALALTQVQADKHFAQAGDTYAYDAIGNLIKDTKEGLRPSLGRGKARSKTSPRPTAPPSLMAIMRPGTASARTLQLPPLGTCGVRRGCDGHLQREE